jgi:putative spermidine/putrescine transport system ATP-binding protein
MRIEIKRIHDELGLTTLYVTHDQSEAMSLSDLVVVMRLGHIEQLGTPQEIYTRPCSLYVADFMGYANRMPVTVVGREGAEFLVRTAAGDELRAVSTVAESQHWQAGQEVLASFRPDETRSDLKETSNRLRGKVQFVEYLGKAFEALVHLGDEGQQLLVQSPVTLSGGTEIEFGIAPDRLLLFPSERTTLESAALVTPQPQESAVEGRR